jgi:hypothetical protein
MADIKLGPEGSEIILPQIRWRGGSAPEIPIEYNLNVETEEMSDKSKRVAFFEQKRIFTYEWSGLTKAQKDIIEERANDRQIQRLQDNWESATWYDVVITAFTYHKLASTYHTGTIKYNVSLTLEEV